ncbi:hypothetical protein [Aliarcobacter butzleri]|uniref:hypothetical protein n=1 Tax=Aliarcobacter butzleri TaxID=28197 RepID=UPI002B250198|nr:hypothetical protein [Aliarcobacter butzleri]
MNSNTGLFGTSNSSGSFTLGELFSIFGVGVISYVLIVIFFVFGFFSSRELFKNEQGNSPSNPSNLIKFIIKPIFWWIGGILTFLTIKGMFYAFYQVSFDSKIKSFLSLRYDFIMGSIKVKSSMEGFLQFIALSIDIFSKFVFWSIPVLTMTFFFLTIGFMINIITEQGNDVVWKKIMISLGVLIFSLVLTNLYFKGINQVFFNNGADIPTLGTVNNVEEANLKVIKYFIRIGLNI